MILLDTDHVSVLQYEGTARCAALNDRLKAVNDQGIATTAITLEEQARGWLADIGRFRDVHRQVWAYDKLIKLFQFFGKWQVLRFDGPAASQFERLRDDRVRIGTPDLKIASIVLVHDALLLSANLRDFRRVSGLRVENWLE
jgi:tRNA(fMet)-specific endonuclease VapC